MDTQIGNDLHTYNSCFYWEGPSCQGRNCHYNS